jgi:carbon starvation protein
VLYCGLASITPVWALLQPRGYLGGFVLYSALAAGAIGLFLGGPLGGLRVEQPALRLPNPAAAGTLLGGVFPFLFVTIACGACSGFHGLVCSGTTSKQVEREPHARPIGYGAMLAEAFVALIALATVMILAPGATAGRSAGRIYGDGIGRFAALLLGEERLAFATTFGAMAFSTFVFDTLDVSTRLGRYIVQELAGWKGRAGSVGATLVVVAIPLLFVLSSGENDYQRFWTLFGASNQLLAALTLLTLTVWLRRSGRRFGFALAPMLFVLSITVWALGQIAWTNLAGLARARATGQPIEVPLLNGIAAAAFLALALFLVAAASRRLLSATLSPAGREALAPPGGSGGAT